MPRHDEATRSEVWRLAMLHWTNAAIGAALGLNASQVAGILARKWKWLNEKG